MNENVSMDASKWMGESGWMQMDESGWMNEWINEWMVELMEEN